MVNLIRPIVVKGTGFSGQTAPQSAPYIMRVASVSFIKLSLPRQSSVYQAKVNRPAGQRSRAKYLR